MTWRDKLVLSTLAELKIDQALEAPRPGPEEIVTRRGRPAARRERA